MSKLKEKFLYMCLLSCFILCICAFSIKLYAAENVKTYTISPTTYQFDESNQYSISSDKQVSSMSFGKKQLGSLSISGDFITDNVSYRDKPGYGLNDNSKVSFSYSYDGSLLTNEKDQWHLTEDTGTSVNGISLNASINKGVLIVQKSTDGRTWYNAVNPITNFYANNSSGKKDFYTTSGEDIANGMFYRVILAYKTTIRTSGGFIGIGEKWDVKKHVELYEFYLALDTGTISIHNLATNETDLPIIDGLQIENIKKAETLLDGSVSTKGFSIDKLGASYVVQINKDGVDIVDNASDGQEFTEDGKYTINVVTKFGKIISKTIYIFNGSSDKGYSTYFGESIISGNRIFSEGEYPTYSQTSSVKINAIEDNVPILTGSITNINTNEVIYLSGGREQQSYALSAGSYKAEFYNSTSEAGSVYHYVFYFNIANLPSQPIVNYNNLMSTHRLCDLTPKHIEVAYPTTRGGYIYVCFSLDSMEAAMEYARDIERRYKETVDGGWLYKSKQNPESKIKYVDEIELTSAINYYASLNVEYGYFNAQSLNVVYSEEIITSLKELESISIEKSIWVFPSEEEKEKTISRLPLINDFTFIDVADYDVVKVDAYCYKNGKTKTLDFNKKIDEQLNVSSQYKITETNKYGDIREYDVYYLVENHTKSVWNVTLNGETTSVQVNNEESHVINADTVSLESIVNDYDPHSIVVINAPDAYSFEIVCEIGELENIGLYKKGQYEITFIDRIGNSYKLDINITGKCRYEDIVKPNTKTYSDFYNSIHIHKLVKSEEIEVNANELKETLSIEVNKNQYSKTSYDNYMYYYNLGIETYQNQNATQDEIDLATSNLCNAIAELVESPDKTELLGETIKFEETPSGLYTSDSYNNWKIEYEKGIALLNAPSVTYEQVINAIASIKEAYEKLELRGNKTDLYDALCDVEKIDCSSYTPASVEALNESYIKAKTVFDDIDSVQSEIDGALLDLLAKKTSLQPIANFKELYAVILDIQSIDETKYTKDSISILKQYFDQGVSVYNNFNSSQDEVDNAQMKILLAKSALVEAGDLSSLENILVEINSIIPMIYTTETIQPLINKYNEAKTIIENRKPQNIIDQTVIELNLLKNNLVVRNDKLALYNYLIEMMKIDLSLYRQSKVDKFNIAYNKAIEILNSYDATEEQVSIALKDVEKAQKRLSSPQTWVIVLLSVSGIVGVAFVIISSIKKAWIAFIIGIVLTVVSIICFIII